MDGSDSGVHTAGLLNSLRRVLASFIGIAQTRIELAVTEIEEQKLRAAQLAVLSIMALLFVSLAIIFGTLDVVMAYWDRSPEAVLGGFAVMYLVFAIIAGLVWRTHSRARPRLLDATLAELVRDREELTPP